MPKYDSSELGELDDRVRLRIGGSEVLIAQNYEVRQSILSQPSSFAARLGNGSTLRELIKRFPPGAPFELLIGPVLQQTGRLDGYEVSSEGPSTITVRGRDALAPFHDAYINADTAFSEATYAQFVDKALHACGVEDLTLIASNEQNRKQKTGAAIRQTKVPNDLKGVLVDKKSGGTKSLQAKVGDRWYEFAKKELDKAGLFLWADVSGGFVLASPNANQEPVVRILRRRGGLRNEVNVLAARHKNDTTTRFSECVVYGRGGGKSFGVTKCKGVFVDEEMRALGYKRPLVFRDNDVSSIQHAEFIARRKIAESRRASWQLVYTVAGHSTPAIDGGGRCVWAVDTCVDVQDDELGLAGKFYVESVEFRRDSSGTTATLTLQRPEDLVFGSGAF